MRVLIDYRPALRQRTGVGEYAHRLASALVPRLAPEGRVVLFSSSWKDRLSGSAVPGAAVVDCRIPVRALNFAWHRAGLPAIERLAGPVDVAHSMHPLRIPARRAAQVVTVHDLFFLDCPGQTAAEIRRDYGPLAAAHARAADAVIVVSEYTAGQVASRLGVPRERMTICPPGAPAWEPRARANRRGPILFVGTIEPRKNVPALLDAYERLLERAPAAPDLLLAGGVGHLDSAAVIARLARPPLAGRAKHLGYVAGERRERLFREASVLVLPSLDEGFGMPALEAMAIGLPVVASSRGALPEVVGDAGQLFDPDDVEGFAAGMARVLEDEAFAARCAEAGIARSRRFSWASSAEALVGAYHRAIARRAERAP